MPIINGYKRWIRKEERVPSLPPAPPELHNTGPFFYDNRHRYHTYTLGQILMEPLTYATSISQS